MEKTKIIKIKDLENEFVFQIRLFQSEEGFGFVDKAIRSKDGFQISQYVDDLLPLVSMMDSEGKNVVKNGLTKKDCFAMFQNPLTIFDLAMDVMEFQMVFLKDSKLFQHITPTLQSLWTTNSLESETK